MEGPQSKHYKAKIDSQNDDENTTLDTFLKPSYLLLASSIPLLLGAYAGYKSEIGRVANAASSSSPVSLDVYSPGFTSSGNRLLKRYANEENLVKKSSHNASKIVSAVAESAEQIHVNVHRVAFKALGIGSLLSVGGFTLLAFGVFKATGSETLDELIEKCRNWAPKKRKELEERFGINPKSMQHEDVIATKGMTDDEEWEFLKKKYIPELVEEESKKKDNT